MTTIAAPPPSVKKYKLVLLGDSGVGKSSIVLRLVRDEWIDNQHSTVGAAFSRHMCVVDNQTVNFDIWDTAGQERYKSLASMYYRGAAAALVVYDITSSESIDRSKYWVRELMSNSPETFVVFVGNKSDLEQQRKVSIEEGQAIANEFGMLFTEASAKNGTMIPSIFSMVAKKLLDNASATTVREGGVVGNNSRRKPKEKSECPC